MVSRSYAVRQIAQKDRDTLERRLVYADDTDAAGIQRLFAIWEEQQGQTRERLVCAVCGDPWLTLTAKRTARPHVRHGYEPTWDRVHELRCEIKVLETELDRLLRDLGMVAIAPTPRPHA